MSTEKDNVVSFQPKAETPQQESSMPKDPIEFFSKALSLPTAVIKRMEEAEEQTREMQVIITNALEKYVVEKNIQMDITVPLLALSTVFTLFAQDMDSMIPPTEKYDADEHYNFRVELSKAVNNTVMEFTEQQEDMKVLAHDLYLGIANALSSHVIQSRVHHFYKSHNDSEPSVKPTDGDKHNI